jgi:arsenite/tail-anchored protein-transporting ATPase
MGRHRENSGGVTGNPLGKGSTGAAMINAPFVTATAGKPMTNDQCAPTHLPEFLEETDLELILFSGKGGVGKTTCATAAALHLATRNPDRRYLAVSIDPAHSLLDSLGGPVPCGNLELLEIDATERLAVFKKAHAGHLRQIAARGTFLDDTDISQLLELSLPGLDEIMAFTEISDLVKGGAYACIIVDTAPTGHTLRFLGLPDTLRKWLEALDAMLAKHRYMAKLYAGLYRKDETDAFLEELAESIGRVASLLGRAAQSRFVPVMLPEAMSTAETERLMAALSRLRIPVSDVLVNRVFKAVADCPLCQDAARRQHAELRRIRRMCVGLKLWRIPLQGGEVRGAKALRAFWHDIEPVSEQPDAAMRSEEEAPWLPPRIERPAPIPGPETALVLFAGKGGVGKTTLACATALCLAQRYPKKRILLFSTDPAHSLSDCLRMPIGAEEVPVDGGLHALEINAEAEFEKLKNEYANEVQEFFASLSGGMLDMEFDHEVMERILDLSPPGLDEIMALTHAIERLESGDYDLFVFDTAPTGHLVRLLELPELIQDWLRVFFGLFLKYKNVFRLPRVSEQMVELSKRTKLLRSLLTDPRKSKLYPVTILTEMALAETRDLVVACNRAGIDIPALLLNMATPAGDCPQCSTVAAVEAAVQVHLAEQLGEFHRTLISRCAEPTGRDRLLELGQGLFRKCKDKA